MKRTMQSPEAGPRFLIIFQGKASGVSATPERLDRKGLDEHFDLLVQGPQVKELINRGFLSLYQMFTLPNVFRRDLIAHKNGEFDLQEAAESKRPSN